MALVHVEFDWNDEMGQCYDCGLPAAYEVRDERMAEPQRFCSVCAAQAASQGEQIHYLFGDD